MSGNWIVDGNDQHLYGQTVSSFISPVAQQLTVASWVAVPQDISQVPVTYEGQGSGWQSLPANPTYGTGLYDGWFRPMTIYSRYWLNTPSRFQAHGKWALHIPNIFAGVSQPVLIGSSVGAALTVVMVVSLATGLTLGLKPRDTESTTTETIFNTSENYTTSTDTESTTTETIFNTSENYTTSTDTWLNTTDTTYSSEWNTTTSTSGTS